MDAVLLYRAPVLHNNGSWFDRTGSAIVDAGAFDDAGLSVESHNALGIVLRGLPLEGWAPKRSWVTGIGASSGTAAPQASTSSMLDLPLVRM